MDYNVSLNLPPDWKVRRGAVQDESGIEITHLEAHLTDAAAKRDKGMIDIYVGEMPEDETAEDQAFANYAEIVGFSDDDPEDFNPVQKFKFNGRNAWGFEALCEDESPMKFISQEVRGGLLAVIVFAAQTDDDLAELQSLIEKGFRVTSKDSSKQ